jgi:hypothetical protein
MDMLKIHATKSHISHINLQNRDASYIYIYMYEYLLVCSYIPLATFCYGLSPYINGIALQPPCDVT